MAPPNSAADSAKKVAASSCPISHSPAQKPGSMCALMCCTEGKIDQPQTVQVAQPHQEGSHNSAAKLRRRYRKKTAALSCPTSHSPAQ